MTAAKTALEARPFAGLAGLRALREPWETLVASAGADRLGNAHHWTVLHLTAFGHGDAVFGWTFHDGEAPVGAVALRPEPSRGFGALPRALLAADGTFDSDYLIPLALPGREAEVAEALLRALDGRREIQAVVLSGLPNEAPMTAALRATLTARGRRVREHPVPCLSAELPETFEAYLANLKSRMRTKVRSAIRKAAEADARLVWCEDDVESHLVRFQELHTARWNALGQPGSFADAARQRFYTELTPWLAQEGTLRFARLERGGVAVAYQYGAQLGERYYQLQEGYDPALEGDRVGTALRGLAMEALIERGVRHYDFMAGDSRHKRDWGAVDVGTTTLAFPLARVRARLAYGLRAGLERLRP